MDLAVDLLCHTHIISISLLYPLLASSLLFVGIVAACTQQKVRPRLEGTEICNNVFAVQLEKLYHSSPPWS